MALCHPALASSRYKDQVKNEKKEEKQQLFLIKKTETITNNICFGAITS